jgi:hypothetical protein
LRKASSSHGGRGQLPTTVTGKSGNPLRAIVPS